MQSSLKANKFLSASVVKAYQGFVDEPVPSDMFDALVSGKANSIYELVKVFALILIGVACATTYFKFSAGESVRVAGHASDIAVSAHSTYSADAVYPVRVSAVDTEHLDEWLSFRVGRNLQAKALDTLGFKLLGANIVPDGDHVSAQIVYENLNGLRLSIFRRLAVGLETVNQSESGRVGKLNWLSWETKREHTVLVSEIPAKELESVYAELCQC